MDAEWIWSARWNESGRLVSEIGLPDLGTPHGRWLEMEGKVCADLGEAGEAELQRIVPYRGMSGRIRRTIAPKEGAPVKRICISHLPSPIFRACSSAQSRFIIPA